MRFEKKLLSDTLAEEAAYLDDLGQPVGARWCRMKADNLRGTTKDHLVGMDGIGFVCGSGVTVCRCGFVADFLCDAPIGDGKTCERLSALARPEKR
jgi:hypothetical protein